jgi:Na+/phosphate symporter
MLGTRTRWPKAHVVSGTALFAGSLIAALGALTSLALARAGVAIVVLGALAYAIDAGDTLRRAASPHVPVRAFVGASLTWLLVAAGALAATTWGAPAGAIAVVAALAGWIGQMVNAHLHHLGARVVLTLLRGDEDETRPWEVLDARLTWTAFALAQLAVLAMLVGISAGNGAVLVAAGACGLGAIVAMIANVRALRGRASRLPIVLS